MTATADLQLDTEAKRAALRRVKRLAAAALAGCMALFVLARSLESRWPAFSFVAAFAEAATIGGIADWYAVVALFRRPLGLPIPHTAIIPANQHRLADNLGRFIEANFLAPGPVREKLRQVDFAALVADWLADPQRAAGLAAFIARLAPQTLAGVRQSGLGTFAEQRLRAALDKVKAAPLAADLLDAFLRDRRHHKLFDEIIKVIGAQLSDEETLIALREKIRAELPSLFRLFRADAYLLKKIVLSAASFLDEVRADPEHPMRDEFDRFLAGFANQLRTSPGYGRRVDLIKRDFLARPEFSALVAGLWQSLADFVADDLASDTSRLRGHIADMLVDVGRHLATDTQIRADMNHGFVVALSSFVESQKSGVSTFIADQVKRWDLGQLTRLVETNIGKDLQYIRFNGMLVGGLVGVALHALDRLLALP